MNSAIIENTDVWNITSHGNGAAYTLRNKKEGKTAFIQYGDDATQWRAEYDAMQEAYANPKSVWHRQTWNACLNEVCGPYVGTWH